MTTLSSAATSFRPGGTSSPKKRGGKRRLFALMTAGAGAGAAAVAKWRTRQREATPPPDAPSTPPLAA